MNMKIFRRLKAREEWIEIYYEEAVNLLMTYFPEDTFIRLANSSKENPIELPHAFYYLVKEEY